MLIHSSVVIFHQDLCVVHHKADIRMLVGLDAYLEIGKESTSNSFFLTPIIGRIQFLVAVRLRSCFLSGCPLGVPLSDWRSLLGSFTWPSSSSSQQQCVEAFSALNL